MAEGTIGEEKAFLNAAQSGSLNSTTVLESLRVQFAPMVKKLARRHAWDADSREELDQEGYLALIEALPLYDPSRGVRLSTFLYHRIRGRMLHWQRSQWQALTLLNRERRVQVRSLDEEVECSDGILSLHEVVAADGNPTSHGAHIRLLKDIVRDALSRLSERQEEALRLFFWDELLPSEIAASLGVSRPRVTVLVRAGLSNLRGELAPIG